MKKIYKGLLIIASVFAITTASNAQYHVGDSMVIQTIMATNLGAGTVLNWNAADPGTWIGVTWNGATPQRIVELNLNDDDCDGTNGPRSGNHSFSVDFNNVAPTGGNINLIGTLDISGLDSLNRLGVNRNGNLAGLNISGLSNLQFLHFGNTGITSLDASGLTKLQYAQGKACQNLTSANFSGCSNLFLVDMHYSSALNSINFTGCTNLEKAGLKGTSLSSINFSGISSLLKFSAAGSALTAVPTNLAANTNIEAIGLGRMASLTTAVDLTPYTSLDKIGIGSSPIASLNANNASVTLIGMKDCPYQGNSLDISGATNLDKFKARGISVDTLNVTGLNTSGMGLRNSSLRRLIGDTTLPSSSVNIGGSKIDLIGATNLALVPISRSANNVGDPVQNLKPYLPVFLIPVDSVDYKVQNLIKVNGPIVSTVFLLLDTFGTQVDSNNNGVFTFTMADTGVYNVEMTNSGISITTARITVAKGCGGYHSGDSAAIRNIFANNVGLGSDLNWDDDCPATWLDVTWDNSNPKRVTALYLPYSGANGGNTNNGNSSNNITGGSINLSVSSITFPVSSIHRELQGNIDFSGLTALQTLVLNGNTNITNINISGLNSLKYLYVGNTGIRNLDASNLTSLLQVKTSMNNSPTSHLNSVDVSGCTNLVRLKTKGADSLSYINVSGCTKLEQLAIKRSSRLTSVDLTGINSLVKFSAGRCALTSVPTNLLANTKLVGLGLARNNLTGNLDISALDSLHKFSVNENQITQITGVAGLPNLERSRGSNNRLSLTNAVESANNNISAGTGWDYDNQTVDGMGILWTDSIDFSMHDSINVTGTMTASSFTLFDNVGAPVTTNNTGIFTFTAADTGRYTVQMSNTGITVTTESIYVLSGGAQILTTITATDFGNVLVGSTSNETLKVRNGGNKTLNITNISLPTGYSINATTATIAAGDSTTFTITFSPTASITYSGIVDVYSSTPTLSGIEQVSITGKGFTFGVGIQDNEKNPISFYPNPTTSNLYIKNNDGTYDDLYIYSMHGMLIKRVSLKQATFIDMHDLAEGVYFIQSIDRVVNQKIIKF